MLRLDFFNLVSVSLFAITTFGVLAALRRSNLAYALLATALVFVGVTVAVAIHPAMSILYLSDLYASAATVAKQEGMLAAGEAVIAANWWNSSGGMMAGLFMQGGFVIASIAMFRSPVFGRATAITGLVANGFDWLHVLGGLVSPGLGEALLWISGPFYLVWFVMLARDLFRYGRTVVQEGSESALVAAAGE